MMLGMESTGNTATTATRSRPSDTPAKERSRPERRRYNGRSAEAVAVRKAVAELKAALNLFDPINPLMAVAIQRAAELGVIAADLRAARLRGEPVDIVGLVRAEGAYRRALADVKAVKPEPPERPGLADWLRATERGSP
jgi:hypothetical protein